MQALVKYGNRDREVELRDVPEPTIGPDDVLLAPRAVGVCGWDIEMWRHKMANPVTVPVVMGHEFCGEIVATGANVTEFEAGARVVSETAAVICGTCPLCRTGNYHLCPDRKGFGYGVDGAFAPRVRVPQRCLHRIADGVAFEHAALTEPACVAYQALVVQSRVTPGRPLLIIGPGPVGLFCLQIAKASGAGPILLAGTDKDAVRFACAEELGADRIIDVTNEDAAAVVLAATAGAGVPLVVDAAGNSPALRLALQTVARLGQITKIGWGPKPVDFSLDPLLSKAARLQGTFSHTWSTWEAVLAMIAQGSLRMTPMVSHTVALDAWRETFEAVEACRAVKAVVRMND